jgi:hypothetical protein
MDQMVGTKTIGTTRRSNGGTMTYQPRFTDARVRARIQQAYGFARGVLSSEEAHGWSTRYIDRYFGQQQHALSQWLRSQLLVCVDSRYSKDTGLTKKYLLNLPGCRYIASILTGYNNTLQEHTEITQPQKLDQPRESNAQRFDEVCVANWIQREFGDELASGNFVYVDQSSRLWHPLQSVRRQYKKPILSQHGLRYHYDIQCAAPTLIHQHAQRQPDPMDMYLSALCHYITNRTQVRNDLAQALEIDIKTAKVLINALFCGARIGNNPDFALSQLLSNDSARIEYLKQDSWIAELRSDIKTCWEYIAPSMTRRSILDKNNRPRMLPISSREKWTRYFQLERLVLNAVIDYMKPRSMSYFLEHDGWACDKEIDLFELSNYVFESTGYQIQFERELVE